MMHLIFLLLTVLLYFALQLVMGYIPMLGIITASIFTVSLIIASFQIPRLRNVAALCAVLPIMTVLNIISLMVPAVPPILLIYSALHYISLYYWINMERPNMPYRQLKYYITVAPLMLIVGILLGFAPTFLGIHLIPPPDLPFPLIYICIPVFAIAEELFFRRLMLYEVSKVAGQTIGIIFVVWVITAFNLTNDMPSLMFIAVSNAIFTVIYSREQTIGPGLIANIAMKTTYMILLAHPV